MRILRLDLLAFGPFTNHRLSLDGGQFGLHLIYGPNEAGKSSALRALRQMLYGIESRTTDDFIHAYGNLRIGAVLQDDHGETLHVVRRKGNKDTLRDADDVAVVESARLARLLAGIDEQQFRQRFGLDHQELVRGAEDLLHGGGELGGALFTAGAGLTDLNAAQKKLAADAEALFKAAGANPRINKTLSDLEVLHRTRRDAQLRPAEWVKQSELLRGLQQEKAAVDRRLGETRAELERFRRIRQALPLAAKRTQLAEQLQGLADAPRLPDGFSDHRRQAEATKANAESTQAEASATLAEIEAALAGLDVSDALLHNAAEIQALQEELGAYRKAARDRPKLVAQRDKAEADARALLAELGREIELDQASALQLTRVQRARLRELGGQQQTLVARVDEKQRRLKELSQESAACGRGLAKLDAPRDTASLRAAIRRVRRAGDGEGRLTEAETELGRLRNQAEVDLRKLGLWSGPLETLETLPLPVAETVDRFEADCTEIENEIRTLRREATDLQSRLTDLDGQIESLRLSQDALTEDDLATARQRRDEGWRLVQTAWQTGAADESAASVFIADFGPAADLAQAYRASVEQADAVSDRLRRESARVAEKAQLLAERQKSSQRLGIAAEALAARESTRQELLGEWLACWQPAGIEPRTPREMRTWLARHANLASAAQSIRVQTVEVETLTKQREGLRAAVVCAAAGLADAGGSGDETLADLVDRCEQLVDQIDAAGEQRQRFERDQERLQQQTESVRREAEQAQTELQQWRDQWAAVVASLALSADATPTEAGEILAAIDALLANVKEAASLRERIDGIDADAGKFDSRVRQLTTVAAPDWAATPADQTVAELAARLERAQASRVRLEELAEQRRRETNRVQQARRQIDEATRQFAALCAIAGCPSPEQLPAVEPRSQQRVATERELRAVEERLCELSVGGSLDTILAQCRRGAPTVADSTAAPDVPDALEISSLDARLAQLTDDLNDLERQRDAVNERLGQQQYAVRQMDGSDRAAQAEEEMQVLLARVRSDVEQYTRLRLASVILHRAIERYREKNQGPVLQRAGRLFAELTLNSFSGLRADYNDKGEPILVGVRPDGRTVVSVEGLSAGTRDQLYFALRLASLEHFLDQNAPLPFIIDDVLVQFDDARSVAALRILANLSARTQIIFFTHHEHLLDLARDHVAPTRLFSQRLG